MISLRRSPTDGLRAGEVAALKTLMRDAFGDDPEEAFQESDWEHALGGVHVLVEEDGLILAHGSVVERSIQVGGRPLRTGYVEAVATRPDRQGHGLGSRLMREIASIIRDGFELGMLGTGSQGFYERLGWRLWRGPSGYRPDGGGEVRPTPDEDGYLMVLATPRSPALDLTAPIVCEWRPGDVW